VKRAKEERLVGRDILFKNDFGGSIDQEDGGEGEALVRGRREGDWTGGSAEDAEFTMKGCRDR